MTGFSEVGMAGQTNVMATLTVQDVVQIRTVRPRDVSSICSWVTTSEALHMVSGDQADCLTPAIFEKWQTNGVASVIASLGPNDIPIGFCTLSTREALSLPVNHIEICHLVVSQEHRHLFVGPRLIKQAKLIAGALGYRFVVGRVNPQNRWILALARHQKFKEIPGREEWAEPAFRWFRFDLTFDSNARRGFYGIGGEDFS